TKLRLLSVFRNLVVPAGRESRRTSATAFRGGKPSPDCREVGRGLWNGAPPTAAPQKSGEKSLEGPAYTTRSNSNPTLQHRFSIFSDFPRHIGRLTTGEVMGKL